MSRFELDHLPPEPPKAGFNFVVKQPWRKGAACRNYPTWLFYDESDEGDDEAKLICASCPVHRQCLAQALIEEGRAPADERFGIRAGLTPEERATLHGDN